MISDGCRQGSVSHMAAYHTSTQFSLSFLPNDFEGAMMLALSQQPDGNWPSELSGDELIERNAMAILFLKQSTSPVLTGK